MKIILASISLLLPPISCYSGVSGIIISEPGELGGASQSENWKQVVDSAREGLGVRSLDAKACEIIAWCAKVDRLDRPPRLAEEAIVLIHAGAEEQTNHWGLAYVGRNHSGPALDREWHLLRFGASIKSLASFASSPTEREIGAFIKATNFALNDFYQDRMVLKVVLYRKSVVLAATIEKGISAGEKRARYSAYVNSIPY